MIRIFGLCLLLAGIADTATAQCATAGLNTRCIHAGKDGIFFGGDGTGARFVSVAPAEPDGRTLRQTFRPARQVSPREPEYHAGDILPPHVMVLLNPVRRGLPRPRDGWVYFAIGSDIYRADLHTRRVLDYVNPHITPRY